MNRLALGAAILMLGGLYPLLRHRDWRFYRERQAVEEILERHPKLQLLRLVVVSDPPEADRAGPALLVEVQLQLSDVAEVIAFRRALKDHRLLSKTSLVTTSACSWWIVSDEKPPSTFDVGFLLIPTEP